jgi:hypothetical protein
MFHIDFICNCELQNQINYDIVIDIKGTTAHKVVDLTTLVT